MLKKSFAVFGLGKFGSSIAQVLAKEGHEVIAVDNDEEKVHDMADLVTCAIQADITEPGVMKSLGVGHVDAAVVAISANMEASIMATILAKEAGVPYVLNKGLNDIHATILKKVGSDEIIFPERAMGTRVAKKMISGNFMDLFELSASFSMVEVIVPGEWAGKSLRELNVRDKYKVNVIAVKMGEKVEVNPDPNEPMIAGETLILAGKNNDLSKILSL